jgi:hypothetical protein
MLAFWTPVQLVWSDMKYLILGVIFLAVPYFLLSSFVMPVLESLEQIYANADAIAQQAAASNNTPQ